MLRAVRRVREGARDATLRHVAASAKKTRSAHRDTPLVPSHPLPPGSSRATVLVLTGPNAGRLAGVDHRGFVVGRGDDVDLVVDDPAVSQRHARIAIDANDVFYIEDLDSMNGTFVGGHRVRKSTLAPGDAIQLGPELQLRFSLSNETDESLQRRLYESSVRDPLTRAFNRAYFADRLMIEIAVAARSECEAALLMIDLDGLKQVNDRHGHLSGDRALSFVAARIARAIRMGDLLARYGGDEFVVLASRTSLAQALILAERVRSAVAQLCFVAGGERVAMTVSVGVASLREVDADARTKEALLGLADERLYSAKRAGRNRVHPVPALAASI
jgi:two-component system, cell cycle response regulator